MRAFLISDNHDTLLALRLAGIKGSIAHTADEVDEAISMALEDKELGILVLSEKIASLVPQTLRNLRERGELPLVVEVPDRHGSSREKDFLTGYLREAIGVNIELPMQKKANSMTSENSSCRKLRLREVIPSAMPEKTLKTGLKNRARDWSRP